MNKRRLFQPKDTLSESLNVSNVVTIDNTENNKENVADVGRALISVTKRGEILNKDSLDNAIEDVKVKNSKSIIRSTNAKVKRLSNNASEHNTSNNVLKLTIGDVVIPKKTIKKSNIQIKSKKKHTNNDLKDCNIVEAPSEINKSDKSSSKTNFKTPGNIVRGKRSLTSINCPSLDSPILASSPIIAVKLRRQPRKTDFLSTSIVASSDNPANSDYSKSSSQMSFISPIKKVMSNSVKNTVPGRMTRSKSDNPPRHHSKSPL